MAKQVSTWINGCHFNKCIWPENQLKLIFQLWKLAETFIKPLRVCNLIKWPDKWGLVCFFVLKRHLVWKCFNSLSFNIYLQVVSCQSVERSCLLKAGLAIFKNLKLNLGVLKRWDANYFIFLRRHMPWGHAFHLCILWITSRWKVCCHFDITAWRYFFVSTLVFLQLWCSGFYLPYFCRFRSTSQHAWTASPWKHIISANKARGESTWQLFMKR